MKKTSLKKERKIEVPNFFKLASKEKEKILKKAAVESTQEQVKLLKKFGYDYAIKYQSSWFYLQKVLVGTYFWQNFWNAYFRLLRQSCTPPRCPIKRCPIKRDESIIGIGVNEPILAVPLAFGSHFAMDILPHFGYPGRKGFPEIVKHKLSYIVGVITLISTSIVILILITNNLWFPLMCGIVAASPDAVGWYNYIAYEKKGKLAKGLLKLLHVDFHRRIQRFERPWGIFVEIFVFTVLLSVLLKMIS